MRGSNGAGSRLIYSIANTSSVKNIVKEGFRNSRENRLGKGQVLGGFAVMQAWQRMNLCDPFKQVVRMSASNPLVLLLGYIIMTMTELPCYMSY